MARSAYDMFQPEPLGVWGWMPPRARAKWSFPAPISQEVWGRIELTIGRLGTGKTTWSALRARHLASATGRQLATTGIGWPRPWLSISSFEEMFALRDAVLVIDEIHLMLPSTKGLLDRDTEKELVRFFSLARKRHLDIVATTQAWTRVATHYRQLITTVWLCKVHSRGKLHCATGFDHPDEGGVQCQPRQYYNPAAARIPTNAVVWVPGVEDSESVAHDISPGKRHADGGASADAGGAPSLASIHQFGPRAI